MLLSCQEEELMVGNFLGDFVKNRDLPNLREGVLRGVRLHRHIDTYTDNHEAVLAGTRRLRKRHGKYAPVVIDILYDYLLTKHWDKYGPSSLRAFMDNVYAILSAHLDWMPARPADIAPRMIADDWLNRYTHYEGLAITFTYLQRRVSKPQYLEDAVVSLQEEEEALTVEFHRFFPDVMGQVQAFCAC